MKKILTFFAFVILVVGISAFTIVEHGTVEETKTLEGKPKIEWLSWEEGIKKSEESNKKIFVDLYTDWCGWCKRMDATTFVDEDVVAYMNENFIAIKFDAEQKENVEYNGTSLKFIAQGRRGVHELAYALLDGKMSYPSYVYLDEAQRRITISPGYKDADAFIKELKFIGEEHYKTTKYQDYLNGDK